MAIPVRRLASPDADQLFGLRRRALLEEPFAFLASPDDDLASSTEAVRNQLSSPSDDAVFGAFHAGELVGMVGVSRDRPIKAAHRACVWGVFVDRQYRKRGVGSDLLTAALEYARQLKGVSSAYLSVSEKTPQAKRLYESVGFTVWGLEPDCIRVDGESAREYHLWLSF
jgi:ribosomal protein S18 acetylase RimI-like enzyme